MGCSRLGVASCFLGGIDQLVGGEEERGGRGRGERGEKGGEEGRGKGREEGTGEGREEGTGEGRRGEGGRLVGAKLGII